MSLSAAKSRVMMAQEYVDKERYDDIEPLLEAALGFLAEVPEAETVTILAEIAAIRLALTTVIMPEEQRFISAAERNLAKARDDMAAGNIMASGILETIAGAEKYLENIAEVHKVALLDEIAALRGLLTSDAPVAPSSTPAAATAPSEDEARALSRARMSLTQARQRDRVSAHRGRRRVPRRGRTGARRCRPDRARRWSRTSTPCATSWQQPSWPRTRGASRNSSAASSWRPSRCRPGSPSTAAGRST